MRILGRGHERELMACTWSSVECDVRFAALVCGTLSRSHLGDSPQPRRPETWPLFHSRWQHGPCPGPAAAPRGPSHGHLHLPENDAGQMLPRYTRCWSINEADMVLVDGGGGNVRAIVRFAAGEHE